MADELGNLDPTPGEASVNTPPPAITLRLRAQLMDKRLVLGFLLASTSAAPEITNLIGSIVRQVQLWLSGGRG